MADKQQVAGFPSTHCR